MIGLLAGLVLAAGPVQLEPAAVTFGADPQPAIVLIAPGAKKLSAVSANGVGAISAPESLGNGRFRARFSLPKERYPQLALIRVELEGEGGAQTRQWLVLPLIATADLKIETKPRATVTVTIGEKTFGPAVADARGNVKIQAQVPPGFAAATVVAVDRAGNRTTQPLDLLTRPYPRAVAVLDVAAATPDQPAPLEIFAVEPDGRPLDKGQSLHLTPKLGACDVPNAGTQGVFAATYRSPALVADGRDRISITVDGTVASTEVEVKLAPGVPARLVLTFSPPGYIAGSGLPSRLRIDSVDAHGNFVGLEKPQLTSDFGQLEATPDGLVLRVPDDFGARATATVRATAGSLRGEGALNLLAAAPAKAGLRFPSRVAAGTTGAGTLTLADAFGNPVRGAAIVARLTGGRTATARETEPGSYALELVTEAGDAPGEDELVLTANGKEIARQRVIILRYERRWAVKLGAQGYLQTNLSQWLSGGPRLSLGLRLAGTGFEVVAEGAYGAFAPAQARSADGQLGVKQPPFRIDLHTFSLALGARYWIPFGVRTSFHVSFVAGLHRTASTVSRAATAERYSDVTVSLIFRAGGGLAFELGPGRVVSQLEYALAPAEGLIHGNVGGVGLGLGYLVSF